MTALKIFHKPMRFDEGYRFFTTLKLDCFNNSQDYLIGALSGSNEINAIYFGKIAEFDGLMGKDLWLDIKGAHVIYIIGKRRSGKSYTLGVIAEGMACDELRIGPSNQAVLILDTLNIFWTMEQSISDEQAEDLKKWGIPAKQIRNIVCYYPRGTRSDYMPKHYKEFAIKPSDLDGADWAALFETDPIVDPMGQLLYELYEKTAIEGYSSDFKKYPPKPEYGISDLLQCLDSDKEVQRYPMQVREAVRRRLKTISRMPIFSTEGTDVRELFKPDQITVLLLRNLDHQIRALVIGVLVKKIMKLRGETDECEKRLEILQKSSCADKEEIEKLTKFIREGLPRGWILIDEAHNYIPQTGIVASKEPLKKYVNEGRNIGLSISVTTQQPSGLDTSIRRNADILIIHQITMDSDVDATSSMINTTMPDAVEISGNRVKSRVFEHMARELSLGYAIISCSNANRLFLAKIRPRITVHGGREY